jgi:SAM-dependent methyltransferase
MALLESSYGEQKRLQFLQSVIERIQPSRVLDIGCGLGTYVTFPLAKAFPTISFLGVDCDAYSIACAQRQNTLPNLAFVPLQEFDADGQFDLIIASEVIEHVERPDEFLLDLRGKLTDDGRVVLTLPNGYGPFELMSLLQNFRCISFVYNILIKNAKKILRKSHCITYPVTFAISPHINFFSYSDIQKLLSISGFHILEFRSRTFLCGFILDHIIRYQFLSKWNARIANSLPPYLNSGWMFVLEKANSVGTSSYNRRFYARLHRYINEKAIQNHSI